MFMMMEVKRFQVNKWKRSGDSEWIMVQQAHRKEGERAREVIHHL